MVVAGIIITAASISVRMKILDPQSTAGRVKLRLLIRAVRDGLLVSTDLLCIHYCVN